MKRIEMFSTVCLDTSCYSTWNYFSQGNCHITHKVPIEQQHCSSSTEPGQCTHKRRIIFIFCYCQNHVCLVNTRRKCFWAALVFFLFVCFLFWLLLWHHTSVSCGPRLCTWQVQWLHGFCQLFQEINQTMEILVLTTSGGQAIPATDSSWVVIRQVS